MTNDEYTAKDLNAIIRELEDDLESMQPRVAAAQEAWIAAKEDEKGLRDQIRQYKAQRWRLARKFSLEEKLRKALGVLTEALPYLERFGEAAGLEPSHVGQCSPPATPCDGGCMEYGQWRNTLANVRSVLSEEPDHGKPQ